MLQKLTTFLGALLLAAFMIAPASAQTVVFSFSGDTTGEPTWQRPFTVGNGTAGSCSLSGTGSAVPYEATSFTPTTTETFDIEISSTDAAYDEYVHLYEGTFDPTMPCVNLIALDDDGGAGSLIEDVALTSGTTYVIVVSGFNNLDFGPYDGEVTTPAPPPVDEAGDIVNEPAADAVGLTSITGTVGTFDDEDCYAINITDPNDFSAEVLSFAPDNDSQLFLFDENLNGVIFDDDDGAGLLSRMSYIASDSLDANPADPGDTDAMLMPGSHFLCISAYDNDPINSMDAQIWEDFGGNVPAPDSGDVVLDDWALGFGGLAGPSDYKIALTGVTATAPNYDLVASVSSTTVPQGGSITVTYSITNNTASSVTGDLFFMAMRDGNTVAQGRVRSGTLPAGFTLNGSYTQNVPNNAPPGVYDYLVKIGNFPNTAVDTESFSITVTGPLAREAANLSELLAEAKQTGDLSLYNETVKSAFVEVGAWNVTNATPWQVEGSTLSASARIDEVGAYPNPFMRSTEIGFSLENAADVSLVIYDVRGREVAHLIDGTMEAGQHSVTFDAASLPSGVYVYRLQAGSQVETGRMTLLQ